MPDLLSVLWWRKFYTRHGVVFNWGCLVIFALTLTVGFGWNQSGLGGNSRSRGPSEGDPVIATINGEPVTMQQFRAGVPPQAGSGEQAARAEGQAVNRLVAATVLRQMAKRYGVKVSDAEVDRKVAEQREQILGKNSTDTQWEDFIASRSSGMTPFEYRDQVAKDPELLVKSLLDKLKTMENVTKQDLDRENQEVRATIVQIGYGRQPFASPKKPVRTLTESEARKKAEDLLAKARAGASIADIAKSNSTDFTKDKGGDLGWMPEFRKTASPMGGGSQETLASQYGKDFAAAVHNAATGQFTDVVKTSQFGSNGFAFAKIEGRRPAPLPPVDPKNPKAVPTPPDPKKQMDDLKQQRATERFGKEFKAAVKAANIQWKPDGFEPKVYYDYAKVEDEQSQAEQARMMAQFGQPSEDPIPSTADIERERTSASAELEQLLAKHPQDSTLALLVARGLKTKLDLAPSDQKAAMRDRVISLYETALKGLEDRNIRFELADLYREKGAIPEADAAYKKISHLLDIAPGFDTASIGEEQTARKRLLAAFRSINKPDEAAAEQEKLGALEIKLNQARQREALQKGASSGPGMAIPPGGGASGGTISLPPATSPARRKR